MQILCCLSALLTLNAKNESPVSDTNGSNEPTTNEGPETTSTSAGPENTNVEENGRVSDAKEDGSRHVGGRAEVASTAAPRDQNVEASSSGQSDIALSPADMSNTLVNAPDALANVTGCTERRTG
jgi:hypothetical protein